MKPKRIGDVIVLVTIDVGKGNFDWERGSQLVDGPDEVHMLDVNWGLEPGMAGQVDAFLIVTVDGDAPMLNQVEVTDCF